MTNDVIELDSKHILGIGFHKTTYLHPHNNNLCIKIPFSKNDIDLKRELTYRKVRKEREQQSTLLPAYLGTILTNKGQGYVFERIQDYNGQTSLSLKEFLVLHKNDYNNSVFIETLYKMLQQLKQTWIAEKIITSDTDPINFMVQEIAPSQYVIRIIDNIGTPVLIPLALYFDFIAKKRVKRYWVRFLNTISNILPPQIVNQNIFKNLY